MPSAEKVKYLGIYVKCKTNCVDPSAALIKFFGSFNNIMSVLRPWSRWDLGSSLIQIIQISGI